MDEVRLARFAYRDRKLKAVLKALGQSRYKAESTNDAQFDAFMNLLEQALKLVS